MEGVSEHYNVAVKHFNVTYKLFKAHPLIAQGWAEHGRGFEAR
jgi:hypothetical protein